MRLLLKDLCSAIFLGMLLPGILLNSVVFLEGRRIQPDPVIQEIQPEPKRVSLPVKLRQKNGSVTQLDMDDYLVGVVLAEMPASFEPAALQAQSVAARTYTQKASATGGKHGDGSLCADSACCQAYVTIGDYLARGGTQPGLEKVRRAVSQTTGQVLTYEGELIEATYFSCSGGSTEDASEVWGTAYPYLCPVDSPGEEAAPVFTDTITFTPEQFQRALGRTLEGYPGTWFGAVTHTEGGGVASMTIGGETYAGTDLRARLGLRSTDFTITTGANIRITTYGYGHRVGMSQYGADAMAVQGSTCGEILAHYYPGTVLTQLG